jgi:hypothetical protein
MWVFQIKTFSYNTISSEKLFSYGAFVSLQSAC